jgi:ubiquinone/menaquinone biosynthesis C-methylase UbiE
MEYCVRHTLRQVYTSPGYLLEPGSQPILLDCGCGDGNYAAHMARMLGAVQVWGIEVNVRQASKAHTNGIIALRADLNQHLPLVSDSIHVVTAFNVLEHLVEIQLALEEMYRVLRPGGYAIINTPNLASWHNIAALLCGMQPFSGPNILPMTESDLAPVRRLHRRAYGLPEKAARLDTDEPERFRHIVVVAFRSLIRALERAGFHIEQTLGFGYYPLPPLLADIFSRLDPTHTHHIVIKARKPAT